MTVFAIAGIREKIDETGLLEHVAYPGFGYASSPEVVVENFVEDFYRSDYAKEGWKLVGAVKLRIIYLDVLEQFLPFADLCEEIEVKVPPHLYVVK